MTNTPLSAELNEAVKGIPGLDQYSIAPPAHLPLDQTLREAVQGISGLEHYSQDTNRTHAVIEKAKDVVKGSLITSGDFVKNNADFLSAFIAGGAVSFGVAAGLHRPDLAITFPMLTFIAGEIIPQGLVGVYKGLSQIERSRIGKPLIGIGKEFTQTRYDKLQNGIVRRVIDRLTKTLASRTYNKIMGGVILGGGVGAVLGGAVEFLAHQAPAPHAAGGRESQANTDGAFRHPPSNSVDVPPPRSGGVDGIDRNDAFHPFMSSDTVSSDVSLPPAVDVISVTQILNDPAVHTSVGVELLTLPQFADNYTSEALNLAAKLIERAKTLGVLTPEKMQQIIDFADKTFQTIHEAKFGTGIFDLQAYRDGAGDFVLNLLNNGTITHDQYAAFQAVDFPAGHSDKVVAWQQLFNIFLGGKG